MDITNNSKNPLVLPNGQPVGVGETVTVTEGDETALAKHPVVKALVADKSLAVTGASAKKSGAKKTENLGPDGEPLDPLS